MTQPRVSRNLGILKNVGLVKDRREGLWVHYSLNTDSFNQYADPILELLRDWINDDEAILRDLEGLAKSIKLGRESESPGLAISGSSRIGTTKT